jgi:hypothetical protein
MSVALALGALLLRSAQDTVAYVPKPSGPPASEPYMWAGYLIALGAYGAYIVLMARRMAQSKQR